MGVYRPKNATSHPIDFTNMMGGECLVGTPETIPDNCVRLAYNWEYGGEVLQPQVVPGVTTKLDVTTSADTGFYDSINDCFLVSSGTTLYKVPTDFSTKTSTGTLNSTYDPVYCLYDTVPLIASGGVLQEFDGTNISDTAGAPTCHHVSAVGGRVRAVNILTSRITYSAIGDRTSWVNNPADISTSQYLDIGYKDPTNIVAVMALSQDTIVIKASGIAYRIINEHDFTNIEVVPASTKTPAYNHYCGLTVGNRAYFFGSDGFQSFSTTDRYGAVIADDPAPGYFINPQLVSNSDSTAKVWHVPSRRQIWVKGQEDKFVYIYHYNVTVNGVAGSWTRRTFYWQINDVMVKGNSVYVLYGNKIGQIDDTIDTDDGNSISYILISKRHTPRLKNYILENFNYTTYNFIAGSATLELSEKSYPYTFSSTDGDIYGDTTEIYGDTSSIVSDQYSRLREILQKRLDYLEAKVTGSDGRMAIQTLVINCSEVN